LASERFITNPYYARVDNFKKKKERIKTWRNRNYEELLKNTNMQKSQKQKKYFSSVPIKQPF